MRKWLVRGLVALAIVLPLGVVAFLIGMRELGPTPAQRLALQTIDAPTPPVQGHDASDAIWLLEHEVPVERWREVATAVRAREAAIARGAPGPADPRQRFARRTIPSEDLPCTEAPGCLAYVGEHRGEVGALIDAHRAGIDAESALAAFDGFRVGVPHHPDLVLPRLGAHRRLVLAELAYRFVSGERLSAVEATCRHIAGWRRVGGNADHLIVSMTGVGNVRRDLVLLADMLAKMPKETELPEACSAALEASADYEFDLCPAVRFEHQGLRGLRAELEKAPADDGGPPLWAIDWRNVEALQAQAYAPYCDPARVTAARADRAVPEPPSPSCTSWRRRADPFGCALGEIAAPGFGKYLDRRADQAQMLALMRAVVWLRVAAENPGEVPAVIARRPVELGLLREPAYVPENDRISIALRDHTHGERFELNAGAEPRPTRARQRSRRSRAVAFAAVE